MSVAGLLLERDRIWHFDDHQCERRKVLSEIHCKSMQGHTFYTDS